jgi:uncharacterized protein YlxW (UPF0749 family)
MEIIDQLLVNISESDNQTTYFIVGGIALIIAMMVMRKALFILIFIVIALVLYFVFSGAELKNTSMPNIDAITEKFDGAKNTISNAMQKLNDLQEKLSNLTNMLDDVSGVQNDMNEAVKEIEKQAPSGGKFELDGLVKELQKHSK